MEDASDKHIVEKQSQLNRSTRGQWNLYSSHRAQLERLLVPSSPGGRICVLGAGNCNDLDLQWLTSVYRQVQLVDIDPEAPERGVKFQKIEASRKIKIKAPIDLTVLADRLGTWAKKPPTIAEVKTVTLAAGEAPEKLAAELNGPFDVVLSPCVLSQLLTPLRDTIGENHPGFMPLLVAMRARHFQLMLDLLAPGGRGVFACDLLSSHTFADLPRVSGDRLPDLMRSMLSAGKCFSGLEPASIAAGLARNGRVAAGSVNLRTAPWLWHLGLSKTYLVYAITFTKCGI